ncbi:HCN2, partial [Symbiodinium sp. CCMP2456]
MPGLPLHGYAKAANSEVYTYVDRYDEQTTNPTEKMFCWGSSRQLQHVFVASGPRASCPRLLVFGADGVAASGAGEICAQREALRATGNASWVCKGYWLFRLVADCRVRARSPKCPKRTGMTKLLRRLGADMEAATGLPCCRRQERAEKNGAALTCLEDNCWNIGFQRSCRSLACNRASSLVCFHAHGESKHELGVLSRKEGAWMASMGMLALLSVFGLLIMESARHMQEHWDVYQKGADQLTRDLLSLFSKVPESFKKQYQEVSADTLKSAQDLFYSLLGNIVNNVSSLILGVLLTMLYTLFWLCSPVPMDSSVDVMFRKYIMFKTLACFGYGISAGLLLYFLSVDLASVFALTTFALNFVPEVGPFIAMVLPCPVIILDSRIDRPMLVLFVAILGQLALKFAFSNIIE